MGSKLRTLRSNSTTDLPIAIHKADRECRTRRTTCRLHAPRPHDGIPSCGHSIPNQRRRVDAAVVRVYDEHGIGCDDDDEESQRVERARESPVVCEVPGDKDDKQADDRDGQIQQLGLSNGSMCRVS